MTYKAESNSEVLNCIKQNFSFVSLSSRSESRGHKLSLEPHTEATSKDPGPKEIPRASFDVLNLCAKFQDHISTGSTLNREAIRPHKGQICACLIQTRYAIIIFFWRIWTGSIVKLFYQPPNTEPSCSTLLIRIVRRFQKIRL